MVKLTYTRENRKKEHFPFFTVRLYNVSHNVVHYDVSQAILERYLFCTFYSNGFGSWACAEVFRLNRTSWCLFPNLCLLYQAFPKIDQDNIQPIQFYQEFDFFKGKPPTSNLLYKPRHYCTQYTKQENTGRHLYRQVQDRRLSFK